MIKEINNIDIRQILNNFKESNSSAYKINNDNYAIFIEPNWFKEYGYNELGFNINKTEEWLAKSSLSDIKDAVKANKVVRVTRKTGVKWRMEVKTLLYIVSSTFYKTKIGNLCLETF